jgi:hypothetical protein
VIPYLPRILELTFYWLGFLFVALSLLLVWALGLLIAFDALRPRPPRGGLLR